jgi:hypothetical protein
MKRNIYTLLAEKYSMVQENPLEVEIEPGGTHKSDHNVEMARTKAHQAAEVAPALHHLLDQMDANAPLQAWMVTHVTQAADMLQDVLAKLREENEEPNMEPVKETDFETPEGDGENTSNTMGSDGNVNGAM